MFIEIHTLTGYSGVLLNRDDRGLAKRLPYGDAVRTRTSSQFAKKKIRAAAGEFALSSLGEVSVRSRETFKRKIAEPLIAEGLDADAVIAVTLLVMDTVYKPSDGAKKLRKEAVSKIAKGEKDRLSVLERGEINVLSTREIAYLKAKIHEFVIAEADPQKAVAAAKDLLEKDKSETTKNLKDNLKVLGQSMDIDVAMFGRMVTGDALSVVDAAVHVAHGLTTHAQAVETDFFSAVDDLVTGEADQGGGHIGEVEITSPLLYGYYVIDWKQLLANLGGLDNAEEVAAKLVSNLIWLVSEQVVGAKKGSTAPYSSADLVMVEIGKAQPRTLAEAFRRKVGPTFEEAVNALGAYLDGKDRMYGRTPEGRMVAAAAETSPAFGTATSLPEIARVAALRLAGAGQA